MKSVIDQRLEKLETKLGKLNAALSAQCKQETDSVNDYKARIEYTEKMIDVLEDFLDDKCQRLKHIEILVNSARYNGASETELAEYRTYLHGKTDVQLQNLVLINC